MTGKENPGSDTIFCYIRVWWDKFYPLPVARCLTLIMSDDSDVSPFKCLNRKNKQHFATDFAKLLRNIIFHSFTITAGRQNNHSFREIHVYWSKLPQNLRLHHHFVNNFRFLLLTGLPVAVSSAFKEKIRFSWTNADFRDVIEFESQNVSHISWSV